MRGPASVRAGVEQERDERGGVADDAHAHRRSASRAARIGGVDARAGVRDHVPARPPLTGIAEVAGPEELRMDEFIRRALSARHDSREAIADENARYFGARLGERILLPGDEALLAETRFEDWLDESVAEVAGATANR